MSRPIVRSSTHTPEGITFEYVLSRAEIKMDKDGKITGWTKMFVPLSGIEHEKLKALSELHKDIVEDNLKMNPGKKNG